jgi:GPH family glycoside/pentoside/hexuronide:cation symporter
MTQAKLFLIRKTMILTLKMIRSLIQKRIQMILTMTKKMTLMKRKMIKKMTQMMTKKRIYVGGTILYSIGCLGFAFVSPLVPGMVAFNLIKSMGMGLYGSVTMGIVADLVSNTKKKTGRFIPGAGFAGLSAADKLGQGLGNVVLGLMLSAAGLSKSLDPAAASPSVVTAVSCSFLWLPLICGAVTAILFQIFYDLDENKDVA